jgi:biotin synthase
VAGGREGHLRTLQALALWPANSLFVEGYLTTRGDAVRDTYRMIREAGFELEGNELSCGEAFGESGVEEAAGGGFRLAVGDGGLLKSEMARED